MAAPVRIWLEVSHHAAFRIGGWAFLRHDVEGLSGQAGGQRRIGPDRAGLSALVAAAAGLPDGAPVEIRTDSHLVLAIPRRLADAEAGKDPPVEDLDLWARATTLLRRRGLTLLRATPAAPTAFATAWAELARDRAKDKGDFTAAIPKPNLSKAGV